MGELGVLLVGVLEVEDSADGWEVLTGDVDNWISLFLTVVTPMVGYSGWKDTLLSIG